MDNFILKKTLKIGKKKSATHSIVRKISKNISLRDFYCSLFGLHTETEPAFARDEIKKTKIHSLRSLEPREIDLHLRSIRRKTQERFDSLFNYNFLNEQQRKQFKEFAPEIYENIDNITKKVYRNKMHPSAHLCFPENGLGGENKVIKVGLFIGSFAPFHMAHLTASLRHLSHPKADSDFVLIVPSADPDNVVASKKPHKICFNIRQEWIEKQIRDFFPLLRFWDIGKTRNPSQIVEELISSCPGFKIQLTQIIGSDPIIKVPSLSKKFEDDMRNWTALAETLDAKLDYRLHVLEREGYEIEEHYFQKENYPKDLDILLDRGGRERPSSTDFQTGKYRGIFYPVPQLVNEFKPIFVLERYGVHAATRPFLHLIENSPSIDNPYFMEKMLSLTEMLLQMPIESVEHIVQEIEFLRTKDLSSGVTRPTDEDR